MISVPLPPHAAALLLLANLGALVFIGTFLSLLAARLRTANAIQREVLQLLVIAHADTCEDGPVEQEQLEGEGGRSVA